MATIEKRIRNALLPFGDPVQLQPFAPDDTVRKPERYYTFQINTSPTDLADNGPQHELCYILVHLVCPLNWDSTSRILATKQVLFTAGATWPEVTDLSDNDAQDIVFECQMAQGVIKDG